MSDNQSVNGDVRVIDGETYWMGSRVEKCTLCGIAPTNVDDCGEFGNRECPYFGIGIDTASLQSDNTGR